MLCKTVQSLQVLKRYKVLLYHLPKFVTHKQTFKSLLITRTIFKPAVRLLVLLGTDIGLTKMVRIFLYFGVTWLPWGFWQNFWLIVLMNYFDELFDEFFDECFDDFFWRFFDDFLWRIFLRIVWQIFRLIFWPIIF